MTVEITQGLCEEIMPTLDSGSAALVLADLPYGITACNCDTPINLDIFFSEAWRILRPNGAIVLNAAQPFTTTLINAQLRYFRYVWVWEKSNSTGHLLAKKRPLRAHEDIVVFYKKQPIYHPQMGEGAPYIWNSRRTETEHFENRSNAIITNTGQRYPRTVIRFKQERGFHPLQKPVSLMSFLIKSYTDEEDLVVDPTCGSGTTLVACLETNRRGVGIEIDTSYVMISESRIAERIRHLNN